MNISLYLAPKNLLSWVVGVGFSGVLFLCLSVLMEVEKPALSTKVFELSTVAPPPPPMPEDMQRKIQNKPKPKPKIKPLMLDNPVKLSFDKVAVNLEVKPDDFTKHIKMTQFSKADALKNMQFEAFSLNELDELPKLLNRPSVSYPRQLLLRGIKQVSVKVLVRIDERGKVKFVNFHEEPKYQQIRQSAKSFVARARFTPPKKDGKKVKAQFIWPIVLSQ